MTTENELLEELVAELYRPPIDPRVHITAPMLAERLNIGFKTAKQELDRKAKEGSLIKFVARNIDGSFVTAYRKPEPERH